MVVLSVIIPVYNSKPWLCRCIDSVVSQRFSSCFETILVDDGSTDGSGAICDTYACRYSNVKAFHVDNQTYYLPEVEKVFDMLGKYDAMTWHNYMVFYTLYRRGQVVFKTEKIAEEI